MVNEYWPMDSGTALQLGGNLQELSCSGSHKSFLNLLDSSCLIFGVHTDFGHVGQEMILLTFASDLTGIGGCCKPV